MVRPDIRRTHTLDRRDLVRQRRLHVAETVAALEVRMVDGIVSPRPSLAAEFEGVIAFDPGQAGDGVGLVGDRIGASGVAD